jgi:hypothetical protein
VEGRNSSVLALQVPSDPALPSTLLPLSSTSVTAPTVPREARTVTGAFGRTPLARSAGETSSTAGVFGTVVELAEVGTEPEPLVAPTAALPEHAPSRKLTAMNAVATTWSRRNFKDFVTSAPDYPPHGFGEGTREISHRVLSTEVLERPADDRPGSQEHAGDSQPPADRHPGRRWQRRRPELAATAVRASAALPIGGRDQCRRVILRPGVQLAAAGEFPLRRCPKLTISGTHALTSNVRV